MEIHRIIADYNAFVEPKISSEQVSITALDAFIKALPKSQFMVEVLGQSHLQKNIYKVQWGQGKTHILLWGGMHGDEPTATAVLCDLCNYLQHPDYKKEQELLSEQLTLHFIPALNPDGIKTYTRENAQNIDLNRDFLAQESPEAQLLKRIAEAIKPDFAFNLHNQNTLWSAGKTGFPATLSFLAPAMDAENTLTKNRKKAMKVISDILPFLQSVLPRQIGKWTDEYEPNAFGEGFQEMGMATILIEGGGLLNDYSEKLRAYYFAAILLSLQSIAQKSYKTVKRKAYKELPENQKNHVHILIQDLIQDGQRIDIALNYTITLPKGRKKLKKTYEIVEVKPNLRQKFFAYHTINATYMHTNCSLDSEQLAHFVLYLNENEVLAFDKGVLVKGL